MSMMDSTEALLEFIEALNKEIDALKAQLKAKDETIARDGLTIAYLRAKTKARKVTRDEWESGRAPGSDGDEYERD